MTIELKHASLTEALSDALRKQIIAGEIAPGEKLTEVWVANRFSVARPTARTGLERLTHEGVLRRGPRRSAMVPTLSADDVCDLYFSREPIESRAVNFLADRRQVPPAAERALLLMRMAAEHDQHADHTEADIALHCALVTATGSRRLQRMHQSVMGEAQLCIAQVRAHAGVDLHALTAQHEAIIEAIRSGVPADADDALRLDLHTCRDMLLRNIISGSTGMNADHVPARS